MAIIEVKDLQFTFPEELAPAIHEINVTIESGSFVLLCGPTGCGKTTLLRHIKPELKPVGHCKGAVYYQGSDMLRHSNLPSPAEIGMVMQQPESQIVMEDVRQELVFGLENLGLPTEVIRTRLAEMSQFFGMEGWIDQQVEHLSGGQKQLLNLASILILQPKVLLLDEPTAQLDPIAANQFLETIRRLNQELGMTVILSEHRLENALPLADQVIVMAEGAILYDGEPRAALQFMWQEEKVGLHAYLPSAARLYFQINEMQGVEKVLKHRVPLSVKEGRSWLNDCFSSKHKHNSLGDKSERTYGQVVEADSKPLLSCTKLNYRYDSNGSDILNDLTMNVDKHEWLALMGGNGSGKSTLLYAALGLLKPQQGNVKLKGIKLSKLKEQALFDRIALLPQNPMAFFVCDTLQQELEQASQRRNVLEETRAGVMAKTVEEFQLSGLLHRHPHDLSGGERQKAALACVLMGQPELLLLDEPTKGLDPLAKQQIISLLKDLHQKGLTIWMVTHDIEFAAASATRCILLFDGAIAAQGSPTQFFSQNYYYTTSINRMVRHHLPNALTGEDVIKHWIKSYAKPSYLG